MRPLVLACAFIIGCTKPEPVQDPLDYLRIGVDPRQEANAIIEGLQRHGFTLGRRIDEPGYVAFDAMRGPDSTIRVVTSRGTAMSMQVPDVRWPERLWLEISPEPRPDFNRDGQRDVIVSIRERGRACLAWAEVDSDGFVSEVFRPQPDWGDSPCVIEIDPSWPRLLLELAVPDSAVPDARVRVPVRAAARGWTLDDSPSAVAHWDRALHERELGLSRAETKGEVATAERLRTELVWLERLRKAKEPVLEPAGDGEEAR